MGTCEAFDVFEAEVERRSVIRDVGLIFLFVLDVLDIVDSSDAV